MGEIIFQIKPSFQIIADLHLQFLQTGIGGIEGPPLFQGINALVPDMPGRIKIRLSDAQGNGIVHFADDIKKFPDTGGLDGYDFLRQRISHGMIFSLVSSFFLARMVP